MADGDDFNAKVVAEFRANGEKVGGFYEKNAAPRGIPVVLLDPVA